MPTTQPVSLYIITFNDADNLRAVLPTVLWADEVVVADSFSTDDTAAVCAQFGVRHVNIKFEGFGKLRNAALALLKHDWVVSVDSDERSTPEFADEVRRTLAAPQHTAYFVPRRNTFLGRPVRFGGMYPDYRQPQVFDRRKFRYREDPVHESFYCDGTIGYFKNFILQHPWPTLKVVMQKGGRYTTLVARQRFEKGKRAGVAQLLGHPPAAFFKKYFFQQGFRDGVPGLMIATLHAFYTFVKYAKLWELQNGRPPAMTLSLVINTFNQPDYLNRVLNAISRQSVLPEEVLLADDGSTDETRTVFEQWRVQQSFRCEHIRQEHQGFRLARILNLAIASSHGDYLVFLDGDTIPHPCFIADHRALARPALFVQGHRALIERKAATEFGLHEFGRDRLYTLCQFQLRGLKHAYRWLWPLRRIRQDLRGVRGCNLAIWRSDLVRVNGYNEAFVGWGREDSELAVRLTNSGVRRLDVRGRALCYHLWHPPVSRDELARNDELLARAILGKYTRCEQGLDQIPVAPR